MLTPDIASVCNPKSQAEAMSHIESYCTRKFTVVLCVVPPEIPVTTTL